MHLFAHGAFSKENFSIEYSREEDCRAEEDDKFIEHSLNSLSVLDQALGRQQQRAAPTVSKHDDGSITYASPAAATISKLNDVAALHCHRPTAAVCAFSALHYLRSYQYVCLATIE